MLNATPASSAVATKQHPGAEVKTLSAKTEVRDFFRSVGMNTGAEVKINLSTNFQTIKLSAQPNLGKPLKAVQYQSTPVTGSIFMVKYDAKITDLQKLTEFTLIVVTSKGNLREYTVKMVKKAEYVN